MAHVEMQELRKSFGSLEVLHGIDLTIQDGEFVVLVGPSGCGKSTLLRMIAGLEEITAGTLKIDGEVMNNVEARERDIAMVFQSYALYPHMSVRSNLGFPLKIRELDDSEIDRRVTEVAAMIGLEDLLDRKPKELSGGQRQRVAMGRAIVRNPRAFLFDEPLSNLDAKLRVQLRLQIRDLHRRIGATSIYVTHDQVEAMTLADRIVLLESGRCQQIGPPIELYDKPANKFVGGFIGSPEMNFVEGSFEIRDGHPIFRSEGGGEVSLLEGSGRAFEEHRPVTLGIRPEHINVGDGSIAAVISDRELIGAETHFFVRWGDDPLTVIADRTVPASATEIAVGFDLASLHFFDKETGIRLN